MLPYPSPIRIAPHLDAHVKRALQSGAADESARVQMYTARAEGGHEHVVWRRTWCHCVDSCTLYCPTIMVEGETAGRVSDLDRQAIPS